jgi:ribose/xylose/arabinose/galactoside ABC-type transport system permease subunit
MRDLIIATLKRFVRVFVSAGIAQLAIIVVANPLQSFDPSSLKAWALILITAFVSGGIAGLDKAIRFKED